MKRKEQMLLLQVGFSQPEVEVKVVTTYSMNTVGFLPKVEVKDVSYYKKNYVLTSHLKLSCQRCSSAR
jgi:hypothetical protein